MSGRGPGAGARWVECLTSVCKALGSLHTLVKWTMVVHTCSLCPGGGRRQGDPELKVILGYIMNSRQPRLYETLLQSN